MSVERWRGVGRIVIGLVAVMVGVLSQLTHPVYLAGDWRADPTLWTSVNVGTAVFGLILIFSGLVPFARRPPG